MAHSLLWRTALHQWELYHLEHYTSHPQELFRAKDQQIQGIKKIVCLLDMGGTNSGAFPAPVLLWGQSELEPVKTILALLLPCPILLPLFPFS